MEYRCLQCDTSFFWPLWTSRCRYLMPGGHTYRLETRAGWCHHCNGMHHFEQLEEDRQEVLDTLEKLRQKPEQKLKRWGFIGHWLFRGALSEIDAYRRLETEERARFQFLTNRPQPCCLKCGSPAAPDTFDDKYWSRCASCGHLLEMVEPVARFHRRSTLTYYDGEGQLASDKYLEAHRPQADDKELGLARCNLWYEVYLPKLLQETGEG